MTFMPLKPSAYADRTHPDFAAACRSWNLAFRHHPALVAEPTSIDEVAAAVAYARDNGLRVAIQSSGHGPVMEADGGAMLLSLRRMDSYRINPAAATATLGGGAQWTSVLAEAQDSGLAPLVGSSPHVGAVGYSLGGGFRWLARRHGLAVDRVRALTVVLADGSVVRATMFDNTELFWAMLGGGAGTLGVVVEMETGLVPVTDVYAGNLFYPIDAAGDVFTFWRDWVEDVDPEFTSSFLLCAFPDLEAVPPPLRGRSFAIVRGCHCGDEEDGQGLVDRWRAWRTPELDTFRTLPFRAMETISNDPIDPIPALSSGRWLSDPDRTTLSAMHNLLESGGMFAEIRHAGGATVWPNPTVSFSARSADFVLEAVSVTPTPEAGQPRGPRSPG